jgi:hypothetical protein
VLYYAKSCKEGFLDLNAWLTLALSAGALVVSVFALLVSLSANRTAGPLVSVTDFQLAFETDKWWLEVKVVNSGHSDIDLDGAWAGWFGATLTELPVRLASASSKPIVFRGTLPPTKYLGDPLTVQIGLGNGKMAMKRIRLNESEIAAQLAKAAAAASLGEGRLASGESALRIEEV